MNPRFLPMLVLTLFLVALPAHAADATLRVKHVTMIPKPPTCEARVTKKQIRSGGSFDIVWKSDDAIKMVGMFKGDEEWPADGRQRVSVAIRGKHVFPLTFISKNGSTATCTAKVFVRAQKENR